MTEELKAHYGLSEQVYKDLMAKVSVIDLIDSLPLFEANLEQPVLPINLCYYIDQKGDFTQGTKVPHRLIAKAVFDSLDSEDQYEIIMYLGDED